jgi:hypothetical protein
VSHDELLQHLRQLEQELHCIETRRDAARLGLLLHPEFEEFGRSGRRHDRAEVLREFSAGGDLGRIRADDFSVSEIADGIALLTYMSAHLDQAGNIDRQTRRSSLWVRTSLGWQLRFHQGTPTDALAQ